MSDLTVLRADVLAEISTEMQAIHQQMAALCRRVYKGQIDAEAQGAKAVALAYQGIVNSTHKTTFDLYDLYREVLDAEHLKAIGQEALKKIVGDE
jgi:hypothetical protein